MIAINNTLYRDDDNGDKLINHNAGKITVKVADSAVLKKVLNISYI